MQQTHSTGPNAAAIAYDGPSRRPSLSRERERAWRRGRSANRSGRRDGPVERR